MGETLTVEEVRRQMEAIASGEVILTAIGEDPQDVYAGNCHYEASNGWRVVVFNDCGEWDYLDGMEAPDGRTIDFNALADARFDDRSLVSDEVAWVAYGIPGYLCWRCPKCGADGTGEGSGPTMGDDAAAHRCGPDVLPRRMRLSPEATP